MPGPNANSKKRPDSPANNRPRKKAKAVPPETAARLEIQMAVKEGSINKALAIYQSAKNKGIKLGVDSYASLLFLCSGGDEWETRLEHLFQERKPNVDTDEDTVAAESDQSDLLVASDDESNPQNCGNRGQLLLDDMRLCGLEPTEICYTALARMAALSLNPERALSLAQQVVDTPHLVPRLRCFVPALIVYALQGDAAGAFRTASAAQDAGLQLGELEYSRLLQAAAGRGATWNQVEGILLSMRNELTALQTVTVERVHDVFRSPVSNEAFERESMPARKASGMTRKWEIKACTVDAHGYCEAIGGGLEALDLSKEEYGDFKEGVARLAERQERNCNDFKRFVEWLNTNGPYGVIVDAANVAFYGQNYESGGFSFDQIDAVVHKVKKEFPHLRPLIVLHVNRTKQPPAQKESAQMLLKKLEDEGIFYAVPHGSNDDWYWLYAAIAAGTDGLVVSNDEMRDHLFHLLAPRFFKRWKERHQLKYHFAGSSSNLEFVLPAPYTTCVQKLCSGEWVFPCVDGSWSAAVIS